MIRVAEISECFPTSYRPQSGMFVLDHARALSEFCRVKVIVPLRTVPPREAVSSGIEGLAKWKRSLELNVPFSTGNLDIEFMRYASLPRPSFEKIDSAFVSSVFGRKLKKMFNEFEPDVVYCHWLRPWAEVSGKIANGLGVPFVIDQHEDLPTLKKLFPDSYANMLKPLLSSHKVIVHSSVNEHDLHQEFGGRVKTELVYLGQSLEISQAKKKFSQSSFRIAGISHLQEERKNIDVLIKAAKILEGRIDFSLSIIGDGPLRQGYESLSKDLNLEKKIRFCGALTPAGISGELDESDLFVLPSYPEAFGLVLTEALARGVPAVSIRGNGGAEELRSLGYPVILAEPLDENDLAEKIISVLNDPELLLKMSDAGKEIVGRHFTWKRNAEHTHNVLSELKVSGRAS